MGDTPDSLAHKAIYNFSLDESNSYALQMSNEEIITHTKGTESAGMYSYHNKQRLSAKDADHDNYPTDCTAFYSSTPWWYSNCWSGSFWGGGDTPSHGHKNKAYWHSSGGEYFNHGSIWIR